MCLTGVLFLHAQVLKSDGALGLLRIEISAVGDVNCRLRARSVPCTVPVAPGRGRSVRAKCWRGLPHWDAAVLGCKHGAWQVCPGSSAVDAHLNTGDCFFQRGNCVLRRWLWPILASRCRPHIRIFNVRQPAVWCPAEGRQIRTEFRSPSLEGKQRANPLPAKGVRGGRGGGGGAASCFDFGFFFLPN